MVEVPIFWKLIQRKVSPKPSMLLLEQPLQRLGRDVAAGDAGAAGADHHLDAGIVDPLLHLGADHGDVVGDDGAVDQHVAVAGDALDQGVARLVGLERAGVGHRQHGDVHRLEGLGFVNPVHDDDLSDPPSCRGEVAGLRSGGMTDWKHDGVRVIPAGSLDTNTAQTPGMNRAAAINFARRRRPEAVGRHGAPSTPTPRPARTITATSRA